MKHFIYKTEQHNIDNTLNHKRNVSLLFNQTCLNERLLPNYTPTHTHIHTHTHIYIHIYIPTQLKIITQLAGTVEYTNCVSAKRYDCPPQ